MKLQVAIDRVTLDEATYLANLLDGKVDVVEMGTSLVKDYGIKGIEEMRHALKQTELLIDLKTIDEGQYEFEQGFKYGGDILTVMGASSIETIRNCYQVSLASNKTMLIDLLEVTEEKISQLIEFEEAIFCLHHSIDKGSDWNLVKSVTEFNRLFPQVKRLGIAGGIDLNGAKKLSKQGLIEVVIVGSNIVKADNMLETAALFMEEIKK